MNWLRDAVIVTGLIVLRTVVPLLITIGVGKLIQSLIFGRRGESASDTRTSVAAVRPNH